MLCLEKTRDMNKSILLTGFMGAGKSTVGRLLADQLNCEFSDLDTVIVEKEGRAISDIFAADGEGYFRDVESEVLRTLDLSVPAVIATGGGIVLRDMNRSIMRDKGVIVYLRASWPVTKSRLLYSAFRHFPILGPDSREVDLCYLRALTLSLARTRANKQ